MLRYDPLLSVDKLIVLSPKWYEYTCITRTFIEDFGEPVFATNGWEYVMDYDRGCRIYGPPIIIQLWNWWRYHKYDFVRLMLHLKLMKLEQQGGYYRDAKWITNFTTS